MNSVCVEFGQHWSNRVGNVSVRGGGGVNTAPHCHTFLGLTLVYPCIPLRTKSVAVE